MAPLEEKLNTVAKYVETKSISLDFILHCGDICHNGQREDYIQVKQLFTQIFPQIPLLVTAGNHDNFSEMEGVFTNENLSGFSETFSDLQVMSLYSSTVDAGEITEEQVTWIEEELQRHPEKTHLLFTHHHFIPEQSPMPSGVLCPSAIDLLRSGRLSALLTGHTHYFYQDSLYQTPYYGVDSLSFHAADSGKQYLTMKESCGYNLFSYENGSISLVEQGNLGQGTCLPHTYFI